MKTRWIVGKPAGKLLRARVQRRLPHSIRDVYIRLKNVVASTYVRNRVYNSHILDTIDAVDLFMIDKSILCTLFRLSLIAPSIDDGCFSASIVFYR